MPHARSVDARGLWLTRASWRGWASVRHLAATSRNAASLLAESKRYDKFLDQDTGLYDTAAIEAEQGLDPPLPYRGTIAGGNSKP